jgi:hypothetical protein
MKKLVIGFISFVILTLLIMHLRHPMFYYYDGEDIWSVASGITNDENEIFPQTIISYEHVDSITPTVFIADPFFIKHDSLYYLFVEHFVNDQGNIAYFVSDDFKNWKFGGVAIDEPFHMSFPQVFEDNGDVYMLPEAGASGNVILYKALSFPDKWVRSDTLIRNVRVKDPALLKKDGFYYIFCVDRKHVQHVYVSNDLHKGWHEHPASPTGLGNYKRAGGRFIFKHGDYYLPVQGCEHDYGTSVHLIKIEKITNREIEISRKNIRYVTPFADMKYFCYGVHQLDMQKIDGKYYYVIDGRGDPEKGKLVFNVRASIVKNLMDVLDYMGIYNIPSFLY